MQFKINEKIFEQFNDLKVGLILLKGIDNTRRISSVESLLRGVCAQKGREFKDKKISEDPMIRVWNEAYGNLGVNPNKFPNSATALLEKVKIEEEVPHQNPLIDLCNYFSVKYKMPVSVHDIDWLCGDLRLTFTKGGESFRPKDSIEVEQAKEGEAAYMDDGGITNRYWNHLHCERTKITGKTANAAIVIEDLSKMHTDEFGEVLRDMQGSLIRYIGGQIEPYIINEDSAPVEMGITGRRSADDSKVPQQEKAHYIAEHMIEIPTVETQSQPDTPLEENN